MMDMRSYQNDVVAWSKKQAALLRAGRFSELDIANIVEEIEDVGKSEERELSSRMAVLLTHLLKWQYQPERQSRSWSRTVKEQRKRVLLRIKRTPSLKHVVDDSDWVAEAWADAVAKAVEETGLDVFPEDCPWTMTDVLSENWLPNAS